MCEYSLEGIRNREAREKETLVLGQISHSTKGFTNPAESGGPVCLCEETVLEVSGIEPWIQRKFGVSNGRAVFAKGPAPLPGETRQHRDGLLFGETFVLLQHLNTGVRISVERIPREEHTIEVLSGDTVKRRIAATVGAAIVFLGGFTLFAGHLPF